MTEYRVVYIGTGVSSDGASVAGRLQRECNTSGREGWRLANAVADAAGGTTGGIWLFFSSEAQASSPAVALAEEIVAEKPLL